MQEKHETQSDSYILATGTSAVDSLKKQHELMAEHAFEQLHKAGLVEGMVVWDVGCGTGIMTEYLAHKVGPSGHVYAIDISAEQLEIAKQRIQSTPFENVTFILGDIIEIDDLPKSQADIVYSRLVLMHLTKPEVALKQMHALLKPNGVISLQESTMSTQHTFPPNATIQDYVKTLVALGVNKGVDYDIGRTLPARCSSMGIFATVAHYPNQQRLKAHVAKELLIPRIQEWKGKAIACGIATKEQFAIWEAEIQRFPEDDPNFYYACAEQTHLLATKLHLFENANTLFLRITKELGYDTDTLLEPSFEGFCLGAAIRWIESQLVNQQALFHQRIRRIFDDKSLVEKINQAKKHFRMHPDAVPTASETELFELLGFIERTILYQDADKFRYLFLKYIKQQEIEQTSTLAASDAIIQAGGLVSIFMEVGSYSQESLEAYLNELAATIHTIKPVVETKIGFLVSMGEHAAAVCYNPILKCWDAMDINQWPGLEQKRAFDVAFYLYKGLNLSKTASSRLALSFTLLITANDSHRDELRQQFELLKVGHSHKNCASEDMALLRMAVMCGELNMVQKLLQHGASTVNVDDTGRTPLMHAAECGHMHIVEKLLEYGAASTIHVKNNEGLSALHFAALSGDDNIIVKLLQLNAAINDLTNNECTPLYFASEKGHIGAVKALISHNADKNKSNFRKKTPLFAAVMGGHVDVTIELLKCGVLVDEPNSQGATPLFIAALQGRLDIVKSLLAYHANPNLLCTGLVLKIKRGHMWVIHDNPPNATPLLIALRKGHSHIAAYLIEHGAAVDQQVSGMTPLGCGQLGIFGEAAESSSPDTVTYSDSSRLTCPKR